MVACVFMLQRARGNRLRSVALLVFSFSTIFLFFMSATYHSLPKGTEMRHMLRVLDHIAIYMMIAGSLTHLHIILFRGLLRWLPLMIVWAFAAGGFVISAYFLRELPESMTFSFFMVMGLLSLFTIFKIHHELGGVYTRDMVVGGICYAIGAIFDFLRWPLIIHGFVAAHEVFHIMVLLGTFFHWRLAFRISHIPVSEELEVLVEKRSGMLHACFRNEKGEFHSKDLPSLKRQVKDWVAKHCPAKLRPRKVRFFYLREENL
tara:strand:+ start:3384 stop:4166 length:783 start_codon:yes stop_codon:yes gene_type:complete